GLMVGPQVIGALMLGARREEMGFAAAAESFAPLVFLAIAMTSIFTSAGEKALYFAPAEVDLLFPAPFARRDLLLYKLGRTALGLFLVSLLFSAFMLIYFRSWLCAFIGLMLTLAMFQLLGMATALVGQIVAESVYTRARKIVLTVVLIALVLGLGQV